MGGGCNREPATRNPKPTGPATRCAKPATRNPTRNPGLLASPEPRNPQPATLPRAYHICMTTHTATQHHCGREICSQQRRDGLLVWHMPGVLLGEYHRRCPEVIDHASHL